jgi:hypothetical protein
LSAAAPEYDSHTEQAIKAVVIYNYGNNEDVEDMPPPSPEDVSYRSWQNNYGKSVGSFAPSQFIKTVYFKAERAGSETTKLPLKLVPVCVCGAKRRKELSQRVHECACGCRAQRDVLSAYLGLHCNPNPGEWESAAVRENHEADTQLLTASHRRYEEQTASRQGFGYALLLDKGSRNCSCGKEERHPSDGHRGLIVRKDLESPVESSVRAGTTSIGNSFSLFWFSSGIPGVIRGEDANRSPLMRNFVPLMSMIVWNFFRDLAMRIIF